MGLLRGQGTASHTYQGNPGVKMSKPTLRSRNFQGSFGHLGQWRRWSDQRAQMVRRAQKASSRENGDGGTGSNRFW